MDANIDLAWILQVSRSCGSLLLLRNPVRFGQQQSGERKGAERGSDDFGPAYRRAVSVRFVFFEPECDVGDGDLLVIEFILLQEMAHQRFSRRGRSHIFVQCFMPLS
jgi:hypothetical protein